METKKFAIDKKWIGVIALGIVLLALVVLLIVFIGKRGDEAKKAYAIQTTNEAGQTVYELVEIAEGTVLPPDAIVGYYENDQWHELDTISVIPQDAQVVYSNPEAYPDSPTAPPSASNAPTQTVAPAKETAAPTVVPTSTAQATDDPNGEVGLPSSGDGWSDDWNEDGATVVTFEDLFGTPTP